MIGHGQNVFFVLILASVLILAPQACKASYNVTMLHEQYTVYACCNVIPHLAMKYFKTDFQMYKNIIWGMEFEG